MTIVLPKIPDLIVNLSFDQEGKRYEYKGGHVGIIFDRPGSMYKNDARIYFDQTAILTNGDNILAFAIMLAPEVVKEYVTGTEFSLISLGVKGRGVVNFNFLLRM